MTNGHNIDPRSLPDLGAVGRKIKSPPNGITVMSRRLEEDGTYEPEHVAQTGDGIQAVAGRSQYVDAEELVEMIRIAVREELRAMLKDLRSNA